VDEPSLENSAFDTLEDSALSLPFPQPLQMDLETLSYSVIEAPFWGTLDLDSVPPVYHPKADFSGSDSFTYLVRDADDREASASVAIEVIAVNDPPTAWDFGISVDEDGLVRIAALDAASDVDGDLLQVTDIGDPLLGTAVIEEDDTVLYVPDADRYGTDHIDFIISDPEGLTAEARVQIQVTAVPDAPVAVDDAASLDEDTWLDIDVLANDTDADGDTLHLSSLGVPSHGFLEVTANEDIRYAPEPNYFGTDSFTYVVEDDTGLTAEARVDITVLPVNDLPVAADVTMTLSYNVATTIPLSATDVDGDSLSFTVLGAPQFGSLGSITNTGPSSAEVTFLADDIATETLSLRVADGQGGVDIAAITLDVVGLSLALAGPNNSFDTDSGQLNGTTPPAWNGGSLRVESFIMAAGSELRITGTQPIEIEAEGLVILNGLIDVSGDDAGSSSLFVAPTASGLPTSAGPGGGGGGAAGGPGPVGTGGVDGDAGLGPGAGGAGMITGMANGCSAGGGGGSDSAGLPGGNWNGGYGGDAGVSFDALATLTGGSGGGGGSVEKDSGYGLSSADDPGAAGGGGGGALSIISHGNLILYSAAVIDARGGDGANSLYGAGGGGGGGGVIELLASGALIVDGNLYIEGGAGGGGHRSCDGGAGGYGIVQTAALP
jgi:hypothetical protein